MRHVLQYGPDVEVLEPAPVREAVVERIGMYRLYLPEDALAGCATE